ncbi:MAG: hypothetical protein Q8P24_02045 [Desulfobacterales bacterium]|nr:hypothetical protein [Desulfobacterales bacterium]MDZ4341691.1 hypothetical protein [Candidatus Binatia bacterium]
MKKCTKCGELKELDAFYEEKRTKCGRRSACKACSMRQSNKWVQKNSEKDRAYKKAYRAGNLDKARGTMSRYKAKIRATPRGNLVFKISCAIYYALKNGSSGNHWEVLVGYTLPQLVEHLEKQFQEGMVWGNYGEWHIDHKIPLAAHNFETPNDLDFKRAWALENLRPMWAPENQSKCAKLDSPFQPSLKLAGG